MKIVFATKNHNAFLKNLMDHVEIEEFKQNLVIPRVVEGFISRGENFNEVITVESNVEGRDVALISGMMNDEFFEAIDIMKFCLKNDCLSFEFIFTSPCLGVGDSARETNPFKNRIEILNNYKSIYGDRLSIVFCNPQNKDSILFSDIKTFVSSDVFYNFFNEIKQDDLVSLYSFDGDFCLSKNKELFYFIRDEGDFQSSKDRRVILFSNMMNESHDWNGIAQKLKDNGCKEIYAFIIHCPPFNKSFISKDLFEQITITDSWYNSPFNCMGEDACQMRSIIPKLYDEFIK